MEKTPKQYPKDAFGIEGKTRYLGNGVNLIYFQGHIIDPLRILPETETDPEEAAKAVNDFQQLGKEKNFPSIMDALRSEGKLRDGIYTIDMKGSDEIITATSEEAVNNSLGFSLGLQIANRLRKATPQNPKYESPTCAIAGSFRFKQHIDTLIQDINTQGVTVLAPPTGNIRKEQDNFKTLEGDLDLGEADIEATFIQKMSEADALYVYVRDGYVGKSVKAELRFAIECGIPILLNEPLKVSIGEYNIGRKSKSIEKEIPILSPSEFSNLIREDERRKKMVFEKQPWYRENKGRLRIFGFTDDRLVRAIFIDMRDVYPDSTDRKIKIKRVSRATDFLSAPSYILLKDENYNKATLPIH